MHVGAPACGMNSATRSFVRLALFNGHNAFGIADGFESAMNGSAARPLSWQEVYGWASQGGSNLGTTRLTAAEAGLDRVAASFRNLPLHGLVIIGGFEARASALSASLWSRVARASCDELSMHMHTAQSVLC